MQKVFKTTITYVVLSEERPVDEGLTMGRIAEECASGSFIGGFTDFKTEELPPEAVTSELKAIGNDGTFFNSLD